MDTGIFISYTNAHYQPGSGTGILEKLGIEYPSIVGKKGHLPSKLFNYFIPRSILSVMDSL